MTRLLWVMLALAGCSRSEPVDVLQTFSYRWTNLNHRVSYVGVAVDGDAADVAVVGGTSTTGVSFGEEQCGEQRCVEFESTDTTEVQVGWSTLEARGRSRVGRGSVDLITGADGTASASLGITLDGRTKQPAAAMIAGWSLSTDEPLPVGAASCYDPRHGWLPREFTVKLGEVAVDGDEATVPVSATFLGGLSLESVRECLDAVADQARVRLTVDVVVVSGAEVLTSSVHQQHAWERDPTGEQAPGEGDDLSWSPRIDGSVAGWRSVSWSFHEEDVEGRGAYLRSLELVLDAQRGLAHGWATNVSVTQLSGFDFSFDGVVVEADVRGDLQSRTVEGRDIPAAVDAGGAATWQALAAP